MGLQCPGGAKRAKLFPIALPKACAVPEDGEQCRWDGICFWSTGLGAAQCHGLKFQLPSKNVFCVPAGERLCEFTLQSRKAACVK